MSAGKKIKVAVVGLGFGAEFIPLYQKHPDAECYAICQRDEAKLNKVGDLSVERRFTRFEDPEVKEIDADSRRPQAHASMSIAALEAGARRLHRPDGHHRKGVLAVAVPAKRRST
jgi:predicted dehydrogenase